MDASLGRTGVDTVVFDIGGVLVDWDPRHLYRTIFADPEEMERFLGSVCTPAWNAQLDLGRTFVDCVAELVERHPGLAAQIRAYDERWDEMVPGAIGGSVSVLADLRDRGVPCYGLTNFSTEKLRPLQERFSFLTWFDGIVVSSEERVVKPDPEIFRRLCERFDLLPGRAVFVDDVPANTAAARALGFTTVDFTTAEGLRAELAALGLLDGGGGGGGEQWQGLSTGR